MEIWRTKIHCPFLKAEVCAYANNQHELGSDLHSNPRKTSFFRAWVCLKMGDGPQKMAVNSYGKWPVHCERKFWGAQFSGKSIFRTQYHEDQWSNFGRSVRSCPKFLSDECCGRGDCCTFSLIVKFQELLATRRVYQVSRSINFIHVVLPVVSSIVFHWYRKPHGNWRLNFHGEVLISEKPTGNCYI